MTRKKTEVTSLVFRYCPVGHLRRNKQWKGTGKQAVRLIQNFYDDWKRMTLVN